MLDHEKGKQIFRNLLEEKFSIGNFILDCFPRSVVVCKCQLQASECNDTTREIFIQPGRWLMISPRPWKVNKSTCKSHEEKLFELAVYAYALKWR